MSKLDRLISRITEDYAQGTRMRCDVCGKITEIQDEGRGPLLCCDKPMIVMSMYSQQTPQLEAGFARYPKGWSNDSVKKFGRTLSKKMKGGVKSKGFFDKCVNKMRGKVDNPEGFCAGVKDETYGSTGWRGKDKSPGQVRADVKKTKFKVEGLERILEYEEAYFITQCDKENDRIEDKLLCLKKAYILCGANRVCQQRIDRFYDALTGNFEGSGEAPLQTESVLLENQDRARAKEIELVLKCGTLPKQYKNFIEKIGMFSGLEINGNGNVGDYKIRNMTENVIKQTLFIRNMMQEKLPPYFIVISTTGYGDDYLLNCKDGKVYISSHDYAGYVDAHNKPFELKKYLKLYANDFKSFLLKYAKENSPLLPKNKQELQNVLSVI